MFGKMKIKSQIIISTAIILGIITLLQIILYSSLQNESNQLINSIFNSITQNTVTQIEELNDNIAESSSLLAVHRLTQASLYRYSHVEIVQNQNAIQNLITDYMSSNQNISFLGIIKEGSLFICGERVELYEKIYKEIEKLPEPKDADPIFLPSFTHNTKTYFTCVIPVFPTDVKYYKPYHTGNFVISIYEMGAISFMPSGVIDSSSISMVITDGEGKIMLSSNSKNHMAYFDTKEIKESYLHKSMPLEDLGWNVIVFMPSKSASVYSGLTLFFTIFMIIFTIAMLFLILKLLNIIIVKRIELLKSSVEKISDSDTTYRISYKYPDEFSVIITAINKVLDTVHNLNEEKLNTLDSLYQAQLLQKETQIFYLYGQVSPHFLYNSLAHIQGLAYEYNAPQISDMVSSLSKVFRYFSNNQTLATIKQDLDSAIEYFNVINMRRTIPINIENNVDSELFAVPCLKMIFQPILENTLKHAFTLDCEGTVTISSVNDDTKAIIEITDNGKGISEKHLESIRVQMTEKDLVSIQSSEHIGLTNVNMRLKLYYNNDCGIEIFSKENEGTKVRITFEKEAPNEIRS